MSIKLPSSVSIPRPGLGAALGEGLAGGASSAMQQRQELMKQLQLEQQKQELKQKGLQEALQEMGFSNGQGEQQQDQGQQQAQDPLKQQESQLEKVATNVPFMMNLSAQNPQMANQIQSMYSNLLSKRKEEQKEAFVSPATKERLTDVFQRQEQLMKEGQIGLAKTPTAALTEKGREDRAEFNTLSSSIEAALLPLVSKGTLAKARFDYLMSLLPKSTNTLAANKGKIKALKREFGLLEKEGVIEKSAPKTQDFSIGGKTYNIPEGEVEEFKKEMGVK